MAAPLKRRIGPGLLAAYDVGVMVGAGIYVLTGATAGAAGMWAPLAFLIASVVAVPTALTFSELSARIPEAAGDSSYIEAGLKSHWLAMLVGWINIIAGTVAAVLRDGVGYLKSIVSVDVLLATIALSALAWPYRMCYRLWRINLGVLLMNLSLILACLWVLASAITAMLPMRRQYIPGLSLLLAIVPLLIFVGYQNGWWITVVAAIAAISMFRNPLRYLVKRALGMPVTLPKDLRKDAEE